MIVPGLVLIVTRPSAERFRIMLLFDKTRIIY